MYSLASLGLGAADMTTTDEALIEAVARAICIATHGVCNVQDWTIEIRDNPNIEMCWNQARAAIAVMPPAPQWRTIDNAPRDGSWFLARDADGNVYSCAFYDTGLEDEALWQARCGQPVVRTPKPTHWMPLITPPAGDDQ